LAEIASSYSEDFDGGAITPQAICKQEFVIVARLSEGVAMPTIARWLAAFWTRFDVSTRGTFAHAMAYAHGLSVSLAGLLAWSTPTSSDKAPRVFAQGACGLALVAMGFLRPSALRPAELSEQDWQGRLAQAFEVSCIQAVRRDLGNASQESIVLTALSFATGCKLPTLRSSAETVVTVLRSAQAANFR
jgi:hypothetical protein